MPKIIVTSRYIKSNAHKRFGNFVKYIATREGVEKPVPKQEPNRELDREIFMTYLVRLRKKLQIIRERFGRTLCP